MSAAVAELIPDAMPAPDPIEGALAKIKQDPGAVFEADVLALLRQVRRPSRHAGRVFVTPSRKRRR